MTAGALCPACGFRLDFEPWTGDSASDEICPCCGIQFGYDDAAPGAAARRKVYRQWRERWAADGMRWFSRGRKPPPGWDAKAQLARLA